MPGVGGYFHTWAVFLFSLLQGRFSVFFALILEKKQNNYLWETIPGNYRLISLVFRDVCYVMLMSLRCARFFMSGPVRKDLLSQ